MSYVMAHARRVWQRITAARDAPLGLAAGLGLVAMSEVVAGTDEVDDPATGFLLGLCATLPLALIRTQPRVAALAITLANALTMAGGLRLTVAGVLAELIVGYSVARHGSRLAAALLLVPFVILAINLPGFLGIGLLALLTGAVLLGGFLRGSDEARARHGSSRAIADTLLEHAARGERARIARELHDVVAHHISLIAVQAETARLTTPGMPAEGQRRLAGIGDTARAALTEMRRLLGVLREDAGAEPDRSPQPGLEELNGLIDEARAAAGTSTRLIVRGRVGPLDPGVELAAFRIVQEALTNARRHAPGAAVDVELDYTRDALRLRVRDNGPGPPPGAAPDGGHGLLGMRERAATAGGTLTTGPGPHGGFLVDVVLPVTADQP
ncbi:MAG TPA: histidine kinase [Actinophytocola sp.]|uniref:sensor histidine kinase n=1 Tax=Actinophytocola sp. TaxID=1872138 RepID=UPI002DBF35CC|nr:histidine kinase [Actinophytocola sp.]HEU5475269.1 histidine kinase [Actinophytocola sp.]